jgi:hypothetical protein
MISDTAKTELIEASNSWRTLWRKQLDSMNGTDQVQAERFRIVSDAFRDVANGKDVEEVVKIMEDRWRSYADEWNAKVKDAGKIKRGPMSGASSIHYKHCSYEAIQANQIYVRNVCRTVIERSQAVGG